MTVPARHTWAVPLPWVHAVSLLEAVAPHHPSFDPELLERVLREVLRIEGEPSPGVVVHRFEPFGASVALLGAEVRLFVHTWPEKALGTLDVHARGEAKVARVVALVARQLGWRCVQSDARERDVGSEDAGAGQVGVSAVKETAK